MNRWARCPTAWVLAVPLMLLAGCATAPKAPWAIDNPYDSVNWATTGRFKAGLHTHTKASDGALYPHEAMDAYKALGYAILAITDHNGVTYPWTSLTEHFGEGYKNRDPQKLGLKDVPGNELSSHHHMNSYWTDHNGTKTEEASLKATAAKGGQTLLCHPGRYGKPASWYLDLFGRYDHLTGIEVYNQGDRYPGDRKKWDEILTLSMPDLPVWGYSNDDMHKPQHLGRNWNIMLLPKPSEKWIRRGMEKGLFYFVYAPKGHKGAAPPEIQAITVDRRRAVIHVEATGCKTIEWISDGQVVGHGAELQLPAVEGLGRYVRAMLYGPEDDTVAGTQPFGIHLR